MTDTRGLVEAPEGVGAEELDRSKAQLRASLVMACESVAGSGEALARQITLFGAPVDDADVLDGIAAIDGNMVSAVAGEMIATQAPVIAAVGPDSSILDNASLADRLAGRA